VTHAHRTRTETPARGGLGRIRDAIPRGTTLPEEQWKTRHRAILILLWAHVVGVPIFGLLTGGQVVHTLLESLPVAVGAVAATTHLLPRRLRAVAASLALLSASAILVHMSGGYIEMHFHFFVMVPVVALYHDWVPFGLAVGYVLLHHGIGGAIEPESVYNHPAALAAPWTWAGIHALFIAGICAICLITWRLNEVAMAHRSRAESEAREGLSVLAATLDATEDGILVVDNHGRIVTHNRRFAEMWRIPEDLLATGDDDRVLSSVLEQLSDPDGFLTKVRELYADPDAESYDELEFVDGRIFERYSHPHRVEGATAGRVWSFRDVTEARRNEHALIVARQRDRELVAELRSLDEAKGLLLTAVSHELRTPLTAIVGFAHVLETRIEDLSPEDQKAHLARLTRNTERLQELVLNLFDLDRISRGIMSARRRPTPVAPLAHSVIEHLELEGRPLAVEIQPGVVADIDRGMVERVLENLLMNAAKHTPLDSPITLRIRTADGQLEIAVEDRGPGVPPEAKESIFEPFQQGDHGRPHSPGTGIGLSLVERFAVLHGGRAWVEDRPGGGASFRVSLPLEEPQELSAEPDSTPVSSGARPRA
jgi:signal transduction histidine kinase